MEMLTLVKWGALFALAWATDRIIKKYWGDKGIHFTSLAIAIYSLAVGMYQRDILEMAIGVLFLWLARPQAISAKSEPS